MVSLLHPGSEIYFPGGQGDDTQLSKTTHLGIGAHPDDLEILAIHGILGAYDDPSCFFSGVTVTNGKSAPRSGNYLDMTDDKYIKTRYREQKKAADIGNYNAQLFLHYDSGEIKPGKSKDLIMDLMAVIKSTSPFVIYTHSLTDRHETHTAVTLHVIDALRELHLLPEEIKLYGCEVWGDLDWLPDEQKIIFDVSAHSKMQRELLSVYHSQKVGNKDYVQAAEGRRVANATFSDPFSSNHVKRAIYAMDMTPLIYHPEMAVEKFISNAIHSFSNDVRNRLNRLRGANRIASSSSQS